MRSGGWSLRARVGERWRELLRLAEGPSRRGRASKRRRRLQGAVKWGEGSQRGARAVERVLSRGRGRMTRACPGGSTPLLRARVQPAPLVLPQVPATVDTRCAVPLRREAGRTRLTAYGLLLDPAPVPVRLSCLETSPSERARRELLVILRCRRGEGRGSPCERELLRLAKDL